MDTASYLPRLAMLPASSFSLRALLNRLQIPSENILLGLAALVGLGSGLAVVLFRYLIGYFRHLLHDNVLDSLFPWGSWTVALLPVLGGLLVSLLVWYFPFHTHGISSVLRSAKQGQRIPVMQVPFKILAASLSLGAGASLGPEGPSVEMGGIIGLLVGQQLKFSTERLTLLVGAGAAAGLAAGFNAPIAGVFLALELVLSSSFTSSTVSVVVLSAVISALVAQVGLGAQPAFMLPAYTQPAFVLPAYEVRSILELPFYLGLGLLASLVSIAFGYSLQWGKRLFQGQIPGFLWLGKVPPLVTPVLGGLCVGIIGLWLPLGLGVGYETIESVLQNVPFSLTLLLGLLVGKLLLTGISLGSGFVGGTFAPSLFAGAVLGSAYGQMLNLWLPASIPVAPPSAYAMVGMAAVLAGSVRAPLTAILLLFEMTRDYHIVLPLMAAVGLSVWITDRFHSPAVYPSVKPSTQEVAALPPSLTVADAMIPVPIRLRGTVLVLTAAKEMLQMRSHCAVVIDEHEHLWGILTLQDIEKAVVSGQNLATLTLDQICTTSVVTVFPDEMLTIASQRMLPRDLHQLLVVSRADPTEVMGLLQREQIILTENAQETRQAVQDTPPFTPDAQLQGIL